MIRRPSCSYLALRDFYILIPMVIPGRSFFHSRLRGFVRASVAPMNVGATRFAVKKYDDNLKKMRKAIACPASFDLRVDMAKVSMDAIRPWIAAKIEECLGFEDEITINYVEDQLKLIPLDPRAMQCVLTGFLNEHTAVFMEALWDKLLAAQAEGGSSSGARVSTKAEPREELKAESKPEEDRRSLEAVHGQKGRPQATVRAWEESAAETAARMARLQREFEARREAEQREEEQRRSQAKGETAERWDGHSHARRTPVEPNVARCEIERERTRAREGRQQGGRESSGSTLEGPMGPLGQTERERLGGRSVKGPRDGRDARQGDVQEDEFRRARRVKEVASSSSACSDDDGGEKRGRRKRWRVPRASSTSSSSSNSDDDEYERRRRLARDLEHGEQRRKRRRRRRRSKGDRDRDREDGRERDRKGDHDHNRERDRRRGHGHTEEGRPASGEGHARAQDDAELPSLSERERAIREMMFGRED